MKQSAMTKEFDYCDYLQSYYKSMQDGEQTIPSDDELEEFFDKLLCKKSSLRLDAPFPENAVQPIEICLAA